MSYLAILGIAFLAFFCSVGIAVTFVLARIGFDVVRRMYRDSQTLDEVLKQELRR